MGNKKQAQVALVATLGSEPQVITSALDLLLQKGEDITAVYVLHTSSEINSPIDRAIKTLKKELFSSSYPSSSNTFFLPIEHAGHPLSDVETKQAVQCFFHQLYRCIWQLKQDNWRIHLSIAGGRKTMSVFGMAVAQLLFDESDCLWHLFSEGEFLVSKRLHPLPNDQVHLIPVPVILWSQISPVMDPLRTIDNPEQAIERVRSLQLNEKVKKAQIFIQNSLTPAERNVVQALVQQGDSDQIMAEVLNLSPRTIEQHLRSSYRKAAVFWNLQDVGRTQLVSLLSLYFSTQITGKP